MTPVHAIILTAPRPNGAFYLGDTLCSLGIKDVTIFHDAHNEGNVLTFKKVLEYMTREHPETDMLFFEDDIVACRGAAQVMLRTPVPEQCAFITWYDGKRLYNPGWTDTTLNIVPFDGNFSHSMAMRFPATMVKLMLAEWPVRNGQIISHQLYNPHPSPRGMDNIMGRICEHEKSRYAIALPNLVQHIGLISGCDERNTLIGGRQSKSFPGEDYDAAGTVYDTVIWRKAPQGTTPEMLMRSTLNYIAKHGQTVGGFSCQQLASGAIQSSVGSLIVESRDYILSRGTKQTTREKK